jgi:hypothetical protein
MNLNTVKTFRHEVYQSFKQAKDAPFNLLDARASEDRAQSLPQLSVSPHFHRVGLLSRNSSRGSEGDLLV